MTSELFLDVCTVAVVACGVVLIPWFLVIAKEVFAPRSRHDEATFQSDGDEIVIMAPPGAGDRYASVFLSKNRRRLGIRLERPGHTIWMDSRIVPRLTQALQEIESRLA